jgi:sucrose-6-phosphate hydrolase SacC (GH32 family)
MKWIKLGQIFDPTEHSLPNGCAEFAQSPQTLVFDDYVRVYFSARARDDNGKYLSHVAFVDFDKGFQKILRVSEKNIIPLGGLGCFDEHGIFPFSVVRSGQRIFAYTTGWNRRSMVSTDGSIGLAISEDGGLTFQKVGAGPVLSASLHEPFLVGDAFVRIFDDTYHMWYIHGTQWVTHHEGEPPDRIYKIAHATSADGISWQKEGRRIISDRLNPEECQALPTVIKIDNRYHMFFCYRESYDFRKNHSRGYRIGYAFSDDLSNWTRDDANVGIDLSDQGWDSEMQCYPHVFEMDGEIYLLYNGNEFGRFGFGLAKLMNKRTHGE